MRVRAELVDVVRELLRAALDEEKDHDAVKLGRDGEDARGFQPVPARLSRCRCGCRPPGCRAQPSGITASLGTTVIANPLVDFGYNLQDADGEPFPGYAFSDIYNLIRDVPQVARIAGDSDGLLLNGAAQDVAIQAWGFPVLGEVTIIDAKTSATL